MRERILKGFTQGDLADAIERSTAYVSNIERDKTDPPFGELRMIASVLECPIVNFFPGGNEFDLPAGLEVTNKVSAKVVTPQSRKRFIDPSIPSTSWELLSPDTRRRMEFLLVRYEPNSNTKELVGHVGEECGIVMQGRLKVCFENEEYILEEGDSIYFDSSQPHGFTNDSDGETITIWVITPPSF